MMSFISDPRTLVGLAIASFISNIVFIGTIVNLFL